MPGDDSPFSVTMGDQGVCKAAALVICYTLKIGITCTILLNVNLSFGKSKNRFKVFYITGSSLPRFTVLPNRKFTTTQIKSLPDYIGAAALSEFFYANPFS